VANDEHVALLLQGTATWNEWRERNPDVVPNLRGADLSGADLIGADLRGADLSDADLSGANLSGAELNGANLSEASLYPIYFLRQRGGAKLGEDHLEIEGIVRANLHNANLSEANLSRAELDAVDLSGANLSTANLSEARIVATIFAGVDLTKTKGLNDCRHDGPSVIDFRTLSLSENLPISFLRGCGLPDSLIEYLPSLRSDAIQFYSCFISYSSKDQLFADRLHADLQNKGVRCWFAPHDLPIGAKTWDAIDAAIRLRDKLLLILSKASIASEWVEDEVNKAYAEERSRKEVVLFPIRVDNAVISTAEPWAVKLRDQRNIGDFRQWKKPAEYQKSLERLLRDLKASGEK
jgi:uncharacterized protein YjbI with pentapeptide repeats